MLTRHTLSQRFTSRISKNRDVHVCYKSDHRAKYTDEYVTETLLDRETLIRDRLRRESSSQLIEKLAVFEVIFHCNVSCFRNNLMKCVEDFKYETIT
jgi:hypothetical protein